jgi:hypothetical protein
MYLIILLSNYYKSNFHNSVINMCMYEKYNKNYDPQIKIQYVNIFKTFKESKYLLRDYIIKFTCYRMTDIELEDEAHRR